MKHDRQTGRLLFHLILPIALAAFATSAAALEAPVSASEQDDPLLRPVEIVGSKPDRIGIGLGALFAAGGTDLTLYYRPDGAELVYGFRYVELEDDFIFNGLDLDSSDRETRTLAGPFVRYLFQPGRNESYYVGASMYRVKLEVECEQGRGSDTGAGLFFGVGMMGGLKQSVGYDIGIFLSPTLDLEVQTPDCESLSEGEFDGILGLFIQF